MDIPVQFFQSTIGIELAVAGALLWEIRYFERGSTTAQDGELPDPRLQLFFALVIGATMFGSLWAIADEGKALAATLVTTGVAISILPVLLRVLPRLARDALTSGARSRLRRHRRRIAAVCGRRRVPHRANQHRLSH